MPAILEHEAVADPQAAASAKAVTVASHHAEELGFDLAQHFVSPNQVSTPDGVVWRIEWIPTNYLRQRGGGIMIDVDPDDFSIRNVLRCQ